MSYTCSKLLSSRVDTPVFYNAVKAFGISYFTGVPDSLLKDFCAYVADNTPVEHHVIAANEGTAIALAAGYYLGSGGIPLVYTQNSGLGNAVNPLLSLAGKGVYGIPMVLMVGWRGEPGVKDEPQHRVMGACQNRMLDTMGICYNVLPLDTGEAISTMKEAIRQAVEGSCPHVVLVRKGTFEKYKLQSKASELPLSYSREGALEVVVKATRDPRAVFVGTTGMLSRELYELRGRDFNENHSRDFLCVGNMGHTSAVSTGIATAQPDRPIVCLDGDGSVLMHMGALATVGNVGCTGCVLHVLFNNGMYESVGGQPTVGFSVDFCKIAMACGYRSAVCVSEKHEIEDAIDKYANSFSVAFFRALAEGRSARSPAMIEVRCRPGVRSDLGRPKTTPKENRNGLMRFMGSM